MRAHLHLELQRPRTTLRMVAHRLMPIRAREAGRELGEVIALALDKVDGEILGLKEQVRAYLLRTGRPQATQTQGDADGASDDSAPAGEGMPAPSHACR
jgi:hypothetical protein